jgi:dihydrofolate reductase
MITLITAVDKNFLIGNGIILPWPRLRADMDFFRKKTLGKTIVMGAITFESLGKALPDRKNIVLSKGPLKKELDTKNITVFDSIQPVLELAKSEEIMIIGGRTIYKEFIPYANKIYITFIDSEFEGDVYFPLQNFSDWKKTEETSHEVGEKTPFKLIFTTFEK